MGFAPFLCLVERCILFSSKPNHPHPHRPFLVIACCVVPSLLSLFQIRLIDKTQLAAKLDANAYVGTGPGRAVGVSGACAVCGQTAHRGAHGTIRNNRIIAATIPCSAAGVGCRRKIPNRAVCGIGDAGIHRRSGDRIRLLVAQIGRRYRCGAVIEAGDEAERSQNGVEAAATGNAAAIVADRIGRVVKELQLGRQFVGSAAAGS